MESPRFNTERSAWRAGGSRSVAIALSPTRKHVVQFVVKCTANDWNQRDAPEGACKPGYTTPQRYALWRRVAPRRYKPRRTAVAPTSCAVTTVAEQWVLGPRTIPRVALAAIRALVVPHRFRTRKEAEGSPCYPIVSARSIPVPRPLRICGRLPQWSRPTGLAEILGGRSGQLLASTLSRPSRNLLTRSMTCGGRTAEL